MRKRRKSICSVFFFQQADVVFVLSCCVNIASTAVFMGDCVQNVHTKLERVGAGCVDGKQGCLSSQVCVVLGN